jgi:ATP-dependent DNA helicase RecQ
MALLRGDETLVLSRPRVRPPREPRASGRRRKTGTASGPDWFTGGPPARLLGDAPGPDRDLPEPDAELLERLKILRRRLAQQRRVPAYVVFNDATLLEMAALKPTTLDELLQVNGVGQAKLDRYGETFLREIATTQ